MFFTRSKVAALSAVVAVSLTLTACSRGDGEDATASSPSTEAASDQRVASLGLGDSDTLLALGITPVAIAPWGSQGDNDASGVGPWATGLLGDAKPAQIYDTASGFTADILEQVTAADPTQIIAVNQAVDSQAKMSLDAIAPTTIKPDQYENWQIPWNVQVDTIASAVNKKDEGEKLINDTKKAFEDFKKDHPEVQGKTAAIGMPYDGKFGLYTPDDGRGQFIENIGFKIPDKLKGNGDSFFVDYAPENYTDLNDVDYLFVLDYHGSAEELKNDPTFQGLDIVKDGRVRYLETDVGNAMSMPNPVTIPWALGKVSEQLS